MLEINTEELPVSYVRPALEKIKNSFIDGLKSNRIGHGNIEVFGTANLLLCYIEDVAACQQEARIEVLGPAKKIAFDKENKPTCIAIGFAKSHGVSVQDLKIKSTNKGEYVFIEKDIETEPVHILLKRIIPAVINSLGFPKTMKWDGAGLRFPRPIESILVLFGNKKIRVRLGNVVEKRIRVYTPKAYLKKLRKEFLIEPDERKAAIKALIIKTQERQSIDQYIDDNLLEEINFMVSRPKVFVGGFNKKFLALPKDVLIASMSKYQRLFPALKSGALVNKFIAVINGMDCNIPLVRKNYEHILDARLKDSLFFYNEDMKRPLNENIAQLKNLIFQKGLGNMFEKILRLKEISLFICEKINTDSQVRKNIVRAAELSKLDLVTHMVTEFPSLEGIMGSEYGLARGEDPIVATAIREHYLPAGAGDSLPSTKEGAILALSDRLDNIAGFIGIGGQIKASFDPYGIRRNTQGLIQIIKANSFRLKIGELVHKSIGLYQDQLSASAKEGGGSEKMRYAGFFDAGLYGKILGYIKERIEFLIGQLKPIELKDAVLASGFEDIVDVFNRINSLSSIADSTVFLKAAKVAERTSNIIKKPEKNETIGNVREDLFKEDLEKEVWKAYLGNKDKIEGLIAREEYIDATKLYGEAFFEVLHKFFDKVLVNVDDTSIRLNRLAMMQVINRLYKERVADLAMLPQIQMRT